MSNYNWLFKTPIAHRGLHTKECPENSLGAFERAIEKGYIIEFDVHLLKDGEIAVFHDDTLSRMTLKTGEIKNLTSKDLKDYQLNKTKFVIPTLDEVLNLIAGKVPILIETKSDTKVGKLESVLLEKLKGYNGEFAIQSFNPFSLAWLKKYAPNIWRGQLSGSFTQDDVNVNKLTRFVLKRMLLNKRVSKPDFISYEAKYLPNKYVDKFKNLPVLAWVVKSEEEEKRVRKFANNIIFENFEPQK